MKPEPTILHDPTSELASTMRPRLEPPQSLAEKTIALLDLGKTRSDEFMDHLEPRLRSRGLDVLRVAKPTNAKPAPDEVIGTIITRAHVVVEALAD
jgi:hypothetical protein